MTLALLIDLAWRIKEYIAIAILSALLLFAVSSCSSNAKEIQSIKTEHKLTLVTEQAAYLAELNKNERINNERWQNAVNQSAQTQKQIASEYANTSAIVDSLSDTIDKNSAAFVTADADARTEYTAAISNISRNCIGEVTELARRADQHVSDIKMMQDAWPKQ